MLNTNRIALRYLFSLLLIVTIFSGCKNTSEVQTKELIDQNYDTDIASADNEAPLFELLDAEVTGINFENTLVEDINQNYKSYAYIYNGGGVGVGDINNDGLPDVFLGGNQVSGKLYLNKGNFKFEDITKSAGLENSTGFKNGVNMVDINADGLLDIYICRGGFFKDDYRRNLCYINNGDLTFTERGKELGIDDASFSTQSYFFDYDNDGDKDLYLLNHPLNPKEANNLKMDQQKDGTLKTALSKDLSFVTDRLYRNDGGKFSDVTEKSGVLNESFGLSAVVNDFNNDGYLDIYVSNDYVKPDNLYINNQDGTFSDEFEQYFKHTSFSSMGSDFADINNDGCQDLMTLDMYPSSNSRQKRHGMEYNFDKYLVTKKLGFATQVVKNTLQISNCNGTYSDIALMAGVAHTDWSWATLMADYDNDGWKDIFVTNGYRRSLTDNDYVKYSQDSLIKNTLDKSKLSFGNFTNIMPVEPTTSHLFRNNRNLTFTDVSTKWNAGPPSFSNGAAYADLDNDGYLDIITNNLDSKAFLYKNVGKKSRNNNYIRFSVKSARHLSVSGTKVEIYDDNNNYQVQMLETQRGFISSVEPVIHFGIGSATKLSRVIVHFPNGSIKELTDAKINQVNTIEYDGKGKGVLQVPPAAIYFKEVNTDKILITHKENDYIDFKLQPLLHRKYSTEGPAVAVADINNDGYDDFFIGGSAGTSGAVYINNKNKGFAILDQPNISKDANAEDVNAIFVDVNNDKALDLVVVSGGNEFAENSPLYKDRLYLNDGKGKFIAKPDGMPDIYSSGRAIAAVDMDGDGDLDLFIGGRLTPGSYPLAPISYLLRNEGNGTFKHITPEWAEGLFKIGMVTAAAFGDLDKDGKPELCIVGEWMDVSIFSNVNGKWILSNDKFGIKDLSGWWESVTIEDLNGDGYGDIVLGNAGLNLQMKASVEHPASLYYNDYDKNGTVDAILCYQNGGKSYPYALRDRLLDQMIMLKKKFLRYRDYADATIDDIFTTEQRKGEKVLTANSFKHIVLMNNGGKSFLKSTLPQMTQISCINTIVPTDVDGDGDLDLITGGNFYDTDILSGQCDASIGSLLLNDGKGNFEFVPAVKSGFVADKNVRHIMKLKSDKSYKLAVFRNAGNVTFFEPIAANPQ